MQNPSRIHWLTSIMVTVALGGFSMAAGAEGPMFETLDGGMKARTLVEGEGPVAEPGRVATIHFIGWLDEAGARGAELYNSYREGNPVSFVVGTDRVMPAWNVGVQGMKPGGKRMLLIPSAMGYGAKGVEGLVPSDAPLMFQIELLKIEEAQAVK